MWKPTQSSLGEVYIEKHSTKTVLFSLSLNSHHVENRQWSVEKATPTPKMLCSDQTCLKSKPDGRGKKKQENA